jgi:outer membrane lipoprotein-sorting protein
VKNRRAFLVVLGAIALAAPAQSAEDADDDPIEKRQERTWYAQALARGAGGLNVTHFWSRGPKMRAETVVAGHKVITIVNGDTYYAYDGLGMDGVAIVRAPSAVAHDAPDRRPFGNEAVALIRQGAEKVREDTMFGRKCDVFRRTDRRGRREVWVTRSSPRIPIRIEIFDRQSGRQHQTDYINWQSGLPIPNSFFEPEAGVKFERYTLVEYQLEAAKKSTVGPVPILYLDLLQGPKR